jgi:DNA repair protein RecN (Recombination protein N)
MLAWLNIQNFAIVSQLELDCPDKMSAFTGETGAGKSIMIDALFILLGNRADSSIIRPNTDKCEIAASFYFDQNSTISDWLKTEEYDFELQEVIVRRMMNKEGRSKYTINGKLASAQQVKTLGEMLIHIHGQHEQQNLLSPHTHREHLDKFSHAEDLRQHLKHCYQDYQKAHTALHALEKRQQAPEQIQLWAYQLSELETLSPKEAELEALYQEQHLLNHAKHYLDTANMAAGLLSDAEEINIRRHLHQVSQLIHQLPKDHKKIDNTLQMIDAAMIQVEEACGELKQFLQELEINPERLDWIENRMSAWHLLARKLQVEPSELHLQQALIQAKLDTMQNQNIDRQRAQDDLEAAEKNYNKAAEALREHRIQHAKPLAMAIEEIIHELGMPHAKLSIDIQPLNDMHPHGMDKVEYLIASNPGSLPGPLNKIASGGELSRISLSIHLITAKRGTTPTLLFDEVDVGIGGATARKVGQRLRELGERLQIFCVTHQPQVASIAHQHFLVQKYSEHNQTFSSIEKLDNEGRIQEIARMLGGLTITEQTRNNARELLTIEEQII